MSIDQWRHYFTLYRRKVQSITEKVVVEIINEIVTN